MTKTSISSNRTRDMVYSAMFVVLIAICSWISIPAAVPFTLQIFGIFVTVGVLGGKRGTMVVTAYLLLGMFGIPVFAGGTGGIGCILGSTGGYIIGFLFLVLTMWGMERIFGKKTWVLAVSMVLGLLVCYAFGTLWFMMVYTGSTGSIGLWAALGMCVFPYVIPDMVKMGLALMISSKINKIIRID